MKYEINLMGFQRFDLGTDVTLLDEPRFVLFLDAICKQAIRAFWGLQRYVLILNLKNTTGILKFDGNLSIKYCR